MLADLGLSVGEAASRLGIYRVGTARDWLALQSAHDLATERAAGLPTVRRLDSVA